MRSAAEQGLRMVKKLNNQDKTQAIRIVILSLAAVVLWGLFLAAVVVGRAVT